MQIDTFKDKVVIVTGDANGIGKCVAMSSVVRGL